MAEDRGNRTERAGEDRGVPRTTTLQRTALIVVVAAIVSAGISGVATASITDSKPALAERDAHIAELTTQAGERDAAIAQLTKDGAEAAVELKRLEEESAASAKQVKDLQTEKAALEQQLDQILNPPAGPTPTASLTVVWVRYTAPRRGGRFVCLQIENTSEGDTDVYYSDGQFTARDAAGFDYPAQLTDYGNPLGSASLAQGAKRRGVLYFQSEGKEVTSLVWANGLGDAGEVTYKLPKASGYLRNC
jgi:hypothetical protein